MQVMIYCNLSIICLNIIVCHFDFSKLAQKIDFKTELDSLPSAHGEVLSKSVVNTREF